MHKQIVLNGLKNKIMSTLKVPTVAEMVARNEQPDILFWVGCSGSFDDRAKKITKAIVKILNYCNVKFAVLGAEESCTGDPAKRAGNEFSFMMQAIQNIELLNGCLLYTSPRPRDRVLSSMPSSA